MMPPPDSIPQSATPPTPQPGGKELCVPLSALAVSDESGEVAPDVGDAVSGNVEGTVSRVEGNMVYITPTKFNGEEITQESTPEETDKEYLDRAYQEANP